MSYEAALAVPFIVVGAWYAPALVSERGRAVHDLVCGTWVVGARTAGITLPPPWTGRPPN